MKKDSAKPAKAVSYDHKKIEKKWQKFWDEKKTYRTLDAKKAKAKGMKPYYVLDMFPYPSGAGLHVGHPRGYIASDVFARMKRMQGYNVLHPMGFDSFGLPAEQYAIQTGKNPGPFTDSLVKRYRKQLEMLGFSYDWDRQVATHDPEYYRWTQWVFLQIYNSYYDADRDKARPIAELAKRFERSGGEGFTAREWKSFSESEKQSVLMNHRLAYEGYAEVNWCPEMGTVLANDEIVDGPNGPVSERGGFPVEKKKMRQWFMRITAYGDRLVRGLEGLDWSDSVKEIQKNWIGKSEGAEIEFPLDGVSEKITVFTTRPDTLFGVTYAVLAPEHPLVSRLKPQIGNWHEVESYVAAASKKDEMTRTANDREKTGVKLDGVFAVNPANGERVPVWVADYVLANYGTGAVMAVPAHDERDWAFAQKYNLPIRHSVAPYFIDETENSRFREGVETVTRTIAVAIVRHHLEDKYLMLDWKNGWTGFITGGLDDGEDKVDAAIRELREETGFRNVKFVKELGNPNVSSFYAPHKNTNQFVKGVAMYFELVNDEQDAVSDDEKKKHEMVWKTREEVVPFLRKGESMGDARYSHMFWSALINGPRPYTDYGVLIDSGEFTNLSSEEAKKKITDFVGGKWVVKYKFRDAIFARQRYWGEPIPLVHKKDSVISEVPEKKLPLELPKVKSYAPAGDGQSPLATVRSWTDAGYETNTMPGWAGSSWYFLRYADPKNRKAFAGEGELDYWFGRKGGVDMYVGGTEHATGHLLYSRFWHKVLHDLGHVKTDEPFLALRNQGMILAEDGRKMSKRWGNVINPDDIVERFGADTMRVYEMFMGPFESSQPWNTDSMVGARRFVERAWRLSEKADGKTPEPLQKSLHKLIRKVSDDIANFSFNTSVSAMMIFMNDAEKSAAISKSDYLDFIRILAPFAPHVTEELWTLFGGKGSVHTASWPKYDPKKAADDAVTMGIQVNGKVRAEVSVPNGATESAVREMALAIPDVAKWVDGREIRKFIFVPGRIISIVV